MRRLSVGFAVIALSAAMTGGAIDGQEARTPAGATDSAAFVKDMVVAGMAEVQLGKLAAERAANADVKAFGQRMVKDHAKANDELKKSASRLHVEMPTQLDPKHQDLVSKLSKLQGAEFDREYMNAMVQGHEEVLGKLRARAGTRTASNTPPKGAEPVGTAGSGADEQALTQWAAKTRPAVEKHLERAKALQQKVAK